MQSPNAKKLRALLKKNDEPAKAVRAMVPPTTLLRHLAGVEPTGRWMARYDLALGYKAADWLSPKEFKKEARRTHAVAYAGLLTPGSEQ